MATYIGYVDTSMVPEKTETEKSTPKNIVIGICNGINNNESDIFPDKTTKEYIKDNPL